MTAKEKALGDSREEKLNLRKLQQDQARGAICRKGLGVRRGRERTKGTTWKQPRN